jgi:hypothetical protein
VPTRGVVYVSQVVDLTGSRSASGIAERKDLGKNFPELKIPFTALDVQDAIGHYAHSASPLLSLQPVVEIGFCSSDRRLRSKWARKPKAIAKTQVQLCRLQDTFQSSAGGGDTLRTRVSGRRQPRMTSADQLSRPPKRSRTWQETKLSSDMIIGAGNENRTLSSYRSLKAKSHDARAIGTTFSAPLTGKICQ